MQKKSPEDLLDYAHANFQSFPLSHHKVTRTRSQYCSVNSYLSDVVCSISFGTCSVPLHFLKIGTSSIPFHKFQNGTHSFKSSLQFHQIKPKCCLELGTRGTVQRKSFCSVPAEKCNRSVTK